MPHIIADSHGSVPLAKLAGEPVVTLPTAPSCSIARTLLSVEEVCALLGVSRHTVGRLARDGRLERITLGHRTMRYTPRSVEALIDPKDNEASADADLVQISDPGGGRVEYRPILGGN